MGRILLWCLFAILWSSGFVAAQENSYVDSSLWALGQLWTAWGASTPDPLQNLAGWNELVKTNPPCAQTSPWRGVVCNAKPVSRSGYDVWSFEIVGLTLRNASIVGSLPPAIGNLSNLVTLTLTNNPELGGDLPEELGRLLSLFDIDLHGNNFTGPIPKFFYDAFGFLQSIDLSDNRLTGELPYNNSVSYRTIQTMNISSNLFSGQVPNNFLMYLQNLVTADLSHNNFTGGLPVMLSPNKTKILDLNVADNHFSGSLPKMAGHATIRFLNASGNLLSGELNTSLLSNIPTLKTLDLSSNQFTGTIPDLSLLENIEHIDLSYNNFTPGPFPVWTNDLKHLQTLLLRGDSITGAVPTSILVSFPSLQTLALDDNNLTGTLDIDRMLTVAGSSGRLQLVSLTNNKISNVAYSHSINSLSVRFNLSGNPYCDVSSRNDLRRCVCEHQCFYTGDTKTNKKVIIISTVVSGFVSACVILIASSLYYQSRRERKKLIAEANQKFAEYEVKPTIYTFAEIRASTGDFHPDLKLGKGHYGAVYRGTLANGTEVAVKQLFSKSQQSLDVFLNEIVLVAAVKHRNLVKLKGCCIRKDQRLLVHEYVEVGDLEQVLFGNTRRVTLSWPVRRSIWIGVANGIHYLHSLAHPKIIHRDIKASNILLDKNLEPKIADFGLALLFPDDQSHIMTIHVAGTRGYLAPEYATLGQLSEKVDVYSFGVLLFELVSGRRNIDSKLPSSQIYLIEWAWTLREEGRMKQLVDPKLSLQIDEEIEMARILDIAFLCVQTSAERRPTMARVVAMLQGDMEDFKCSELSRFEHEESMESRVAHYGSLGIPFPTSDSTGTTLRETSSSTGFYRNSPSVFEGSTPSGSRDSLLSTVSRVVEMPLR